MNICGRRLFLKTENISSRISKGESEAGIGQDYCLGGHPARWPCPEHIPWFLLGELLRWETVLPTMEIQGHF